MKTVGTLLQEARLAKELSLTDVERVTKIREKFLVSIEADEFCALPSLSYAKGFIRNYAQYLGISSELAMAFFRRQTEESSRSSLLPKGVSDPLNTPMFQLTPGRFIGLLVVGLFAVFLTYFIGQYRTISTLPQLTVLSPIDQAIVTTGRVVVEGKTDSDATVTIDGISTIVRDDGRFYEQVPIERGVNKLTIIATSKFGKSTTVIREVGLQQ